MKFAAKIAILALVALSLPAQAQDTVSVGGALESPVGSMTSFSVFTDTTNGGAAVASLRITQDQSFNVTQTGNNAPTFTGGGVSVSGSAVATPGAVANVTFNRVISPTNVAPVSVISNTGGSFTVPRTTGNVAVNVTSAPPAVFGGNSFGGSFAPAPTSFGGNSFSGGSNFGGGFFSSNGGFFSR